MNELEYEYSKPIKKKSIEVRQIDVCKDAIKRSIIVANQDNSNTSSKLMKNPLHVIHLLPDAVCVITSGAVIVSLNQKFKQSIPPKTSYTSQCSILSCIKSLDRDKFSLALHNIVKGEDQCDFTSVVCKTIVYNMYGNKTVENCEWILCSDGTPDCILVTIRTHDRSMPKSDKVLKSEGETLSSLKTSTKGLSSKGLSNSSSKVCMPNIPLSMSILGQSCATSAPSNINTFPSLGMPIHRANSVDSSLNHLGRRSAVAVSTSTTAIKHKSSYSAFSELVDINTVVSQPKLDMNNEMNDNNRNFVRNLSHLIRSPMSAALAALYVIEREIAENSPNAIQTVRDVRCSCENAVGILNDYLTYDKLKSIKGLELDMTKVDLIEIVRNSVEHFRLQATYSNVSLQYAESIGNLTEIYVNADVINICHVLCNLLSCSLKYTTDWGYLKIEVALDSDAAVRINFKESSSTFSSQTKEDMLLDSSVKLLLHGSGLGLYVSKQIVELHGGVMEVVNGASPRDSYFSMVLPLVAPAIIPSPSMDDNCMTCVDLTQQPKPRLLIVDDDPVLLKIHARLLSFYTDSCMSARNGADAVCIAKFYMSVGRPFDCILMDSSMPILDGPNATKQIREAGFTGKIYGVTGNFTENDVDMFMNHGVDKVFIKPLRVCHIQEIISSVTKV